MKHHRVQMVPVAVRARFCVRERFSAGREKSDMPARTRDHFVRGQEWYKQVGNRGDGVCMS